VATEGAVVVTLTLAIPPVLLGLLMAMDPLERWVARPVRLRGRHRRSP
jgi:L-cystine uptake protein TcyP (sodium:dicarboxylate symporter family)